MDVLTRTCDFCGNEEELRQHHHPITQDDIESEFEEWSVIRLRPPQYAPHVLCPSCSFCLDYLLSNLREENGKDVLDLAEELIDRVE